MASCATSGTRAGRLRIGALARHRDVLESPVVGKRYTLLADAERMIADPLVRNMGTVGGASPTRTRRRTCRRPSWPLAARSWSAVPDGERTIAHRRSVRRPLRDRPWSRRDHDGGQGAARSGRERLLQGQAQDRGLRRRRAIGVALSMSDEEIETSASGCAASGARRCGPGVRKRSSRGTSGRGGYTGGPERAAPRSAIPQRTLAAPWRTSATW